MVNSKCHRHQICVDGLYSTCFLNSKINAKSVDLPKNTMIPATFSTILWRISTFQNKSAKTEKVRNPTTFDSWRHRVPVNCGKVMISYFRICKWALFHILKSFRAPVSIFTFKSAIKSRLFLIFINLPWPLRIFHALLYTDTLLPLS